MFDAIERFAQRLAALERNIDGHPRFLTGLFTEWTDEHHGRVDLGHKQITAYVPTLTSAALLTQKQLDTIGDESPAAPAQFVLVMLQGSTYTIMEVLDGAQAGLVPYQDQKRLKSITEYNRLGDDGWPVPDTTDVWSYNVLSGAVVPDLDPLASWSGSPYLSTIRLTPTGTSAVEVVPGNAEMGIELDNPADYFEFSAIVMTTGTASSAKAGMVWLDESGSPLSTDEGSTYSTVELTDWHHVTSNTAGAVVQVVRRATALPIVGATAATGARYVRPFVRITCSGPVWVTNLALKRRA